MKWRSENMGFFKDGITIFGGCIGLILLLVILMFAAAYITDLDFNPVIDNNTTIELNNVTITVPQSNNTITNNSTTLDYFNFNKGGYNDLDLNEVDNFNTKGTAHEYHDIQNDIKIMVIDKQNLPYIDKYKDGEQVDAPDGGERYFQQKKTINDKVVIVWVYQEHGKGLSQKIINSAKIKQ